MMEILKKHSPYVYGQYTHITMILVVSSFACIEFFFFFFVPLPSILHALWTHRKWSWVVVYTGLGLDRVEKTDRRHRSCWGRTGAGSSPATGRRRYEDLVNEHRLKSPPKRLTAVVPSDKLTCDVDFPRQSHVRFAHSAQEGAVVDQPRDAVIDDHFSEMLVVQHVGVYEGTW